MVGWQGPVEQQCLRLAVPQSVAQMHSAEYRNRSCCRRARCWWSAAGTPERRSPKTCTWAGREVIVATGRRPALRCAHFYRGRDLVDWLADMGCYDMPVEKHPLPEGVRDNTNHHVAGRDGRRDIDLRR